MGGTEKLFATHNSDVLETSFIITIFQSFETFRKFTSKHFITVIRSIL